MAIALAGAIPSALTAPARVLWITPSGDEAPAGCAIVGASRWACDELPEAPHGLVVIVDASGALAYVPIGFGETASGGVAPCGRVVQVVAGGAAPEDIHNIRVSAGKPERPLRRAQSQRFLPVEDDGIQILPLSGTAFWVAGRPADKDSYIQVEGPAIATSRVPAATLSEGPPEWPIVLVVDAPFAMTGQVQTSHGDDVDGATVELFEPLRPLPPGVRPLMPEALIRRATTISRRDGTFTFDQLAPGRYHISVVDASLGRGEVDVRSLGETIRVRLVAPLVAKGRVLRHSLPVPDARVRFVPDASAVIGSTNPEDHIAGEATTAADGRFSLALPPDPAGAIQVIGPDNAAARVPIIMKPPRDPDILLGDIVLPEQRRVGVRVAGGEGCALSAVGPLGQLGLSTVQAAGPGPTVWLDLPEGGDWALTAQCDGTSRDVSPRIFSVPQTGPDLFFDVKLVN